MAGPFGALGCIPDVVESTDPKTLEVKLAQSFARQLLSNPASQFVELQSSGGGDGAVFQVTLYYSTEEDGNYPPLSEQHVKVVWGSDPKTVLAKIADFYATVAVDRTTFVEKSSAGAGALWVDIIVYTLGEDLALAALELEDVDEVTAGVFAAAPPVPAVDPAVRRARVAKRAKTKRQAAPPREAAEPAESAARVFTEPEAEDWTGPFEKAVARRKAVVRRSRVAARVAARKGK